MIGLNKNYIGFQLKPDSTKSLNGWSVGIRIIKVYETNSMEKRYQCEYTFRNKQDAEDYAYWIGTQMINGKHPDFIVDF